MTPRETLDWLVKNEVRYIDLRFTDTRGKEQHVTLPATVMTEEFFADGKMFDGSSIVGWRRIHDSDMILMPDAESAILDSFRTETTALFRADVYEPATRKPYGRDPRSLAKRAEAYLKDTGIADQVMVGPENEFFIFDSVRWDQGLNGAFYEIDSLEGAWNSASECAGQNSGHRPPVKGGYFPVPPVDSLQDLRSEICSALTAFGLKVEVHHHEVATAGQCEIGVGCNGLVRKADEVQLFKYVVMSVAARHNKTATFMPKPLVGDNGSGMHVHTSLMKGGQNLFTGKGYAGLSDLALHFVGGIIHHAKALNALTNPSTNSYRRLVPGFEAPVKLAYSARNRSAAIRIPFTQNPKGRRVEIRFPDSTANPYLAFAGLLMAGIDGIQNRRHPGEPQDRDLYELPPEEDRKIPQVAYSLEEALHALETDHAFLLAGGVFSEDLIGAYLGVKQEELNRVRMCTHPIEFELYYSL
ncbi:MAG: type I glutamate--ammonia ligase [Gammaproteobacteria bacterium]